MPHNFFCPNKVPIKKPTLELNVKPKLAPAKVLKIGKIRTVAQYENMVI